MSAVSRDGSARRSASPTHASQACKRCHTRKRKCDRVRPRCAACVEADAECEVEIRSDERALQLQVKRLRAANVELERRLSELQQERSAPAASGNGENPSHRSASPLGDSLGLTALPMPSLMAMSLSMRPGSGSSGLIDGPADAHSGQITSAADHPDLPSRDQALRDARDYLSSYKQAHHNVEEDEILQDVHMTYGPRGLVAPDLAAHRYRCFSALYFQAVVRSNLDAQSADANVAKTCRILAMRELPRILEAEDLTAVQALVFLAVFAVYQPGGPRLGQIVAIAGRMAFDLLLHRRDDVYLAPLASTFPDADAMRRHNERRKNIFWAYYSLDRLAMFTLGYPPSIRDSDIDVDFPSAPAITSSLGISGIALRNHTLHQRRLYGEIQDALYSASAQSDSPLSDREAVVADFVRRIQHWYSTNPLKSAYAPPSDATIMRQSLDDISYHQMIIALHRPSPLIPYTSSHYVTTTRDSATISLNLYRHYWPRKQVSISWVHLYYIFTSCTALIYCVCEYHSRPDLADMPAGEVDARIDECRDLLAKFGPAWPESARYQAVFDALVQSFRANSASRDQGVLSSTAPSAPTVDIQADWSSLADPEVGWAAGDAGDFASLFPDLTAMSPSTLMRGFWSDHGI